MLTQIIKETENGYIWLHDSAFEDMFQICNWLRKPYSKCGFNLWADLEDYYAAEKAYLEYITKTQFIKDFELFTDS